MTDADLDSLEKLCAAATPGPWHAPSHPESVVDVWVDDPLPDGDQFPYPGNPHPRAVVAEIRGRDAAFIAASRSALPRLIEEVRRLRGIVRAVASNADDLKTGCRFCFNGCVENGRTVHAPDCPWRRAREAGG